MQPAARQSRGGEFWVQLRALLERNVILKRRMKKHTVLEVLAPLIAVVFMSYIYGSLVETLRGSEREVDHLHLEDAVELSRFLISARFREALDVNNTLFAIAPADGIGRDFYDAFTTDLDLTSDSVRLFSSSSDITEYVVSSFEDDDQAKLAGAVVFTSDDGIRYSYDIRLPAMEATSTAQPTTRDESNAYSDNWTSYTRSSVVDRETFTLQKVVPFVALQETVDQFLLQRALGTSTSRPADDTIFLMQPFPELQSTAAEASRRSLESLDSIIGPLVGIIFATLFGVTLNRLAEALVKEKELRIKEHMKTMGMRDSALILSWFLTYLVIFFTIAALATAISAMSLFTYAHKGYVFALFLMFELASFAFVYLITAFFTRTKLAVGATSMLFMLPVFVLYAFDETTPRSSKMAACLAIPNCFSFAVSTLTHFEANEVGISSTNIGEQVNNFSVSDAFTMLTVDFFAYFVLAVYLSQVLPSKYGTRKSPYFFLLPSYWSSRARERLVAERRGLLESPEEPLFDERHGDPSKFEVVSDELAARRSIQINNLVKEFGGSGEQKTTAVDRVNLDVFEGQILSLLGHNGAGKTTLINLLAGFYPPTSGDAFMLGGSVATDIGRIRKDIAMCAQHDALYPILTAKEQLQLYASIKGVPRAQRSTVVDQMLATVGLTDAGDTKCEELSGGMKRKLSVGMALIGDSKIVFLDEPTTGVDPHMRHELWDIIREQKQNRTIILTTHYMDEADFLGDRIAIMANGQVKCWGSPLFLKNRFGVGYTMVISKRGNENGVETVNGLRNDDDTKEDSVLDDKKLSGLILDKIDGASQLTSAATELSFRLPFESCAQFPALFDQLDAQLDELDIESYGISVTTLEEVFLRVSNESEGNSTTTAIHTRHTSASSNDDIEMRPLVDGSLESGDVSGEGGGTPLMECPLRQSETEADRIKRQIRAVIKRRFWEMKRDRRVWALQVAQPALIILVGVITSRFSADAGSVSHSASDPRLEMSSQLFNRPNIVSFNQDIPRAENLMSLMNDDVDSVDYEGNPFGRDLVAQSATSFQETLLTNLNWTEHPHAAFQGASQYSAMALDIEYERSYSTRTGDVIFFNTTAAHALPITVNQYNNLVGRTLTNDTDFKITVSSHPFPWPTSASAASVIATSTVAVLLVFALAYAPVNSVFYAVRERAKKTKHLQMVNGTNGFAFWMANFIWDSSNFLLPVSVILILLVAFDIDALVSGDTLAVLVVVLLCYALSSTAFAYLVSFLFKTPSTAQSYSVWFFIIPGILPSILTPVSFVSPNSANVINGISYIFSIFPSFCLAQPISMLTSFQYIGGTVDLSAWDWTVSTRSIFFMLFDSVVYFCLVLFIDKAGVEELSCNSSRAYDDAAQLPELDPDVAAEAARVLSAESDDDAIRLVELRKEFPPKTVVRNISFGVPKGQIFGFLGTNGAGKTTTLRMLTSDILATSGNAFIAGHDILTGRGDTHRKIGYCPQFDALYDHLTGREHLLFYSQIKGVRRDSIDAYVDALLAHSGLVEHKDKQSQAYSGGTKRKLSVAISLIGDPEIIFLDEPTSGMDPGSRRFVWDLVSSSMRNRSVILTTHSMEEAQALCDRITIMVNGQLRCIGSFQHLKFRYGSGYQVECSIEGEEKERDAFTTFFKQTFESPELLESHAGTFKYRIGKERTKLSDVFRTLEEQRKDLNIRQYSVSETTLEQIFARFAKEQEDLDAAAGTTAAQ